MKYLFAFFTCALFYIPISIAKERPVKLNVHIDKLLTEEAQWVYWVSLIGNEYDFIDSLYIEKGIDSFELEHTFTQDEECYSTWLCFAKKGPSQSVLSVKGGDQLIVYIDEKTGLFPKGVGSADIEESYANLMSTDDLNKEIRQMEDSLAFSKEQTEMLRIGKALDSLNYYMKVGIRLEFMERSKSACVYLSYLAVVNDYLPEDEINELVAIMKKRFPYSREVQMYPKKKYYPKESEHSKDVRKRLLEIHSNKYNIETIHKKPPRMDESLISEIRTYKLHDKVANLSLTDISGNIINMDDIKSEYILIDFWASWCGPCRKEIPYLRATLNKYPDDLTILAVSIDEDEGQWRESIKFDKTDIFLHTLLGNNTTESMLIQKLFGVKAIPANFLLNKDREIVATNLRKEALMEEIDKRASIKE